MLVVRFTCGSWRGCPSHQAMHFLPAPPGKKSGFRAPRRQSCSPSTKADLEQVLNLRCLLPPSRPPLRALPRLTVLWPMWLRRARASGKLPCIPWAGGEQALLQTPQPLLPFPAAVIPSGLCPGWAPPSGLAMLASAARTSGEELSLECLTLPFPT